MCNLWSDLDIFLLNLYTFTHNPEDHHMSDRNMVVTTVQ
jgi:hypothetical protein